MFAGVCIFKLLVAWYNHVDVQYKDPVLNGHDNDLSQVLFFCFYYLQCFRNTFLLVKWNFRISRCNVTYFSPPRQYSICTVYIFYFMFEPHFLDKLDSVHVTGSQALLHFIYHALEHKVVLINLILRIFYDFNFCEFFVPAKYHRKKITR